MLNKLLLNNQIITNKKKIQQARIQTINKLVQKLRKLKNLNEKKPNNAKITKNLQKTTKTLEYVKKIKVLNIVQKTITLCKKPAAILTNGQAAAEDIAIALLASNKILSNFINILKTLLTLDDTNPRWKDEIMEISNRKKKLQQNGETKNKRKAAKTKKQSIVKKLPWKEENQEDVYTETLDDNEDTAVAKGWKIEPVSEAVEKPTKSNKPKEIVSKNLFNVVPKEAIKESSTVKETSPELPNLKPVKTVDSFFFTDTGDNYLSTVVIDRIQPDGPNDGLIRRERRDNTKRPYEKYNKFSKQPVRNGRIDKRQSFEPLNKKPTSITDEKLHPSWAAKQKFKPIITQFKGQKTTFDDEGQDLQLKSFKNKPQKSSHQTKESTKVQSQDDLHPSWAAKQKLKPAITEFKGKKITFDD